MRDVEPLVEVGGAEVGGQAGHERPSARPGPGPPGVGVGDDLAGIAAGRQGAAEQVVQREGLGTARLDDAVVRRTEGDVVQEGREVLGAGAGGYSRSGRNRPVVARWPPSRRPCPT
jgi:hypothetical protein